MPWGIWWRLTVRISKQRRRMVEAIFSNIFYSRFMSAYWWRSTRSGGLVPNFVKHCMMENSGSYQLVGPLPDNTVESRQYKLSYFELSDNSTLHAGPVHVPSLKRLPIICTRHYSNTFLVPLELDLMRFHCITCNAWFDLSLHLQSLEAPLSLDLSKHLRSWVSISRYSSRPKCEKLEGMPKKHGGLFMLIFSAIAHLHALSA